MSCQHICFILVQMQHHYFLNVCTGRTVSLHKHHSNNTRTITNTMKSLPELLWCNVLISTTHVSTTPHEMSKTSAQVALKQTKQNKSTCCSRKLRLSVVLLPPSWGMCHRSSPPALLSRFFGLLETKCPLVVRRRRSAARTERSTVFISGAKSASWTEREEWTTFTRSWLPQLLSMQSGWKILLLLRTFKIKLSVGGYECSTMIINWNHTGYCREVTLSHEHSRNNQTGSKHQGPLCRTAYIKYCLTYI